MFEPSQYEPHTRVTISGITFESGLMNCLFSRYFSSHSVYASYFSIASSHSIFSTLGKHARSTDGILRAGILYAVCACVTSEYPENKLVSDTTVRFYLRAVRGRSCWILITYRISTRSSVRCESSGGNTVDGMVEG